MRAAGAVLVVVLLLLSSPAAGLSREDTPGVHPPAESSRSVVPTSVLVVADETGASAALHALDRVYAELSALVKPDRDAILSMRPPQGRRVGPTVTVSWLLRDTAVWRTDVIYYRAPGGPWIETEIRIDGVDADSRTEWHTSSDADRLVAVLAELGVLETGAGAGSGAPAAGDVAAAPAPAADAAAPAPADSNGTWPWAVGGLLAGALLTLTAAWLTGWRPRPDREPRQQLIDL